MVLLTNGKFKGNSSILQAEAKNYSFKAIRTNSPRDKMYFCNMKENSNLKNLWSFWLIAAIGLLYFIPYFILGENAYVRIHDTLEGEWIWLSVLCDSHQAFNFDPSSIVPNIMNGLPRNVYPSPFNFNLWLVYLFGSFNAYVISAVIIHVIGFASMFVFLSNHILTEKEERIYVRLIALIFSVLGVFVPFGLAVMGQPLIAHIFYQWYKNENKWYYWPVIILYPIYTQLVFSLIPFFTILGCYGLWDLLKKRRLQPLYWLGMIVFGIAFLVWNYQMLYAMVYKSSFVSHRSAYDLYRYFTPEWTAVLGDVVLTFLTSHYHIATFVSLPVLAVLYYTYANSKTVKSLFWLILVIALFQGFYPFLEYGLFQHINFFKAFRLNRYAVLLPFLWLTLLAAGVKVLVTYYQNPKIAYAVILTMLYTTLMGNDELLHNYRTLIGFQKLPSFQAYLAQDQFKNIDKKINKPKSEYRVVSIGMSPTISQYNGFYTLDGLMSIYDLNYKKQFGEIIKEELEKDMEVKSYFEGWGNRCYIFSSEKGKAYNAFYQFKGRNEPIAHLSFDDGAFKRLGGVYVISACAVNNAASLNWELITTEVNPAAAWNLYVYKVN